MENPQVPGDPGARAANPYAPPQADLDHGVAPAGPGGPLATRLQRFGGAIVDGILYAVASAPAYMGISFMELGRRSQTSSNPFLLYTIAGFWGFIAAGLTVSLWIVQWYLIATRGQSIGKIVAKTRIVRVDGGRAGFKEAVALRTWIPWAVSLIPKIGGVLAFIDILFVFRSDRRCVHDLIAGTKVIDVEKTG